MRGVENTNSNGGRLFDRSHPPFWLAALQLAAISFHLPLLVLSGRGGIFVSVSNLVLSCLVVTAVAIGIYLALSLRFDGWAVLLWVTIALLAFWHSGGLPPIFGLSATITALVILAVQILAATRLAGIRIVRMGALVASLTLVIAPMALALPRLSAPQQATIQKPVNDGEFALKSSPDIFLLILDGYGRGDVISEIYEFDNSDIEEHLEARGFEVFQEAHANYPATHFSLSSLLNMSYVHNEDLPITDGDLRNLAMHVSGENAVVDVLKAHDYFYVHAEAGSWLTDCGPRVDYCVPAPLVRSSTHRLFDDTPIEPLFYPRTGDATTAMNLTRIGQMVDWPNAVDSPDDQPAFHLIHLLLPHPPLFLNESCEPRPSDEFAGASVAGPSSNASLHAARRAAWVEQVRCANRTIENFLKPLGEDDVVVITADHGPDSIAVPIPHGTTWEITERAPTFTAMRLPTSCAGSVPQDVALVNLFRYVFACLSEQPPTPLPDRSYFASFDGFVREVETYGE